MLVFVFSSLLSFLVLFALATHVIGEEPNRLANRLFSAYCYTVAAVALIEFTVALAPTRELARAGAYVAAGWPVASGLFFHFCVVITARAKRWERWAIRTAYAVAAAMAVGFFIYVRAGQALAEMPPHSAIWGAASYTIRTPMGPAWYELIVVLGQPLFILVSLSVLLRSLRHGTPGLGWREIRWVFAAYGSMALSVAVVAVIRAAIGIAVPDVIGATYLLFALGIFIALRRRALLILTPHRAIGSIVSAMEELLFLTDPDFKIIFINPTAGTALGLRDSDASGRPLQEILPRISMPKSRASLEPGTGSQSGDSSHSFTEIRVRSAVGEELVLSMTANELRDRAGGLSGWVFIGRDVTEERRSKERIARSLAEKDTLLREVHHRVGNSLQLIISLLNLQMDSLDDSTSLLVVEKATQRIILISRVYERAYSVDNVSAVPIDDFFAEIAQELKLEAPARHTSTVFGLEPLQVDLQRAIPLTMVFTELYQDALARLSADGAGEIRLTLAPADEPDSRKSQMWELAIVHAGIVTNHADDADHIWGEGIVEALCAQLRAELSVEQSGGETAIRLLFPV
ncbi:MAG: PAS domain-containing protein [Spirochaetes bacterium]|nr:PAS domain-containing protein [Spirochaetota bacterium]